MFSITELKGMAIKMGLDEKLWSNVMQETVFLLKDTTLLVWQVAERMLIVHNMHLVGKRVPS